MALSRTEDEEDVCERRDEVVVCGAGDQAETKPEELALLLAAPLLL